MNRWRRLDATHYKKSPRGHTSDRDRGQALVEFALVIPLFALMVAGTFDFGLAFFSNQTIINAAREGARVGIVDPGNTAAVEARVHEMSNGIDRSRLRVTVSCQRPSGTTFVSCSSPLWQSGDATAVRVDYDYSMIFPLLFGTQVPLTTEMRMRIE